MGVENINHVTQYRIKLIIPVFVVAIMALGACSSARQETEPVKQTAEKQQIGVAPQKASKPTNELMRTIKKPTNLTELLKNIKYAIDNELLIRDAVYTDDNLKNIFGEADVVWKSNELSSKRIQIKNIGNAYKGMKIDVYCKKVNRKGESDVEGNSVGSGAFDNPHDQRFNSDMVMEVFGTALTIEDLYANFNPKHPQPIAHSTHKFGCKIISYTMETVTSKASFHFVTRPDGVVDRCNFYQVAK